MSLHWLVRGREAAAALASAADDACAMGDFIGAAGSLLGGDSAAMQAAEVLFQLNGASPVLHS